MPHTCPCSQETHCGPFLETMQQAIQRIQTGWSDRDIGQPEGDSCLCDARQLCGPIAWEVHHAWADAIYHEICPHCGEFAQKLAVFNHDLVNAKLGKPLKDPALFSQMCQTVGELETAQGHPPGSIMAEIEKRIAQMTQDTRPVPRRLRLAQEAPSKEALWDNALRVSEREASMSQETAKMSGTFEVAITVGRPNSDATGVPQMPGDARTYQAIVDTGWWAGVGLPPDEISALGLPFMMNVPTVSADQVGENRPVYMAGLEFEGQVVPAFVQPAPVPILGSMGLEMLRYKVDPVNQRLERHPASMLSTTMPRRLRARQSSFADTIINGLAVGAGVTLGGIAVEKLIRSAQSSQAEHDEAHQLPSCTRSQARDRERCIESVKAENEEAGCPKEGTYPEDCPATGEPAANPWAVCNASVGCRE